MASSMVRPIHCRTRFPWDMIAHRRLPRRALGGDKSEAHSGVWVWRFGGLEVWRFMRGLQGDLRIVFI
jgi:hypothetical protein